MSSSFTYYFEEVFPTYDDWKDWISNYSSIVNYDDVIQSEFDRWVFDLLYRHFNHQNIRYTTQDAFKLELLNVYENKFKQFLNSKSLIDKMYQLTDDELLEVSINLNNFANNSDTAVANDTEILPFCSSQSWSKLSSNKLQGYMQAINQIPSLQIYKFLKTDDRNEMAFSDLFMKVVPNIKYYYNGGE